MEQEPSARNADISWDDEAFATDSEYRGYREDVIARARAGDMSMARELATLLVAALRSRSGLPPELEGYLTDALCKISKGEDPGAAFNVKRKVGSPRGDPDENLAVVALVEQCRRGLRNDGASASIDRDRKIDRDAKTMALDAISNAVGGGRKLHRYGGRKLHTPTGCRLWDGSGSRRCTGGRKGCCYVTIWNVV